MQITHRHVEAFQTVILTGSFTKAAKVLRTSQPSISRTIQQLQRAVGFALFTRIDGHTVPTAEALEWQQEIERSFLGLDKILQRAVDIRDQRIGRLRVVSMPALAQTFLPHVLARFLAQRDNVVASLQVQRSETIASWITTQQFDLGFAMLPLERPGVRTELFDAAHGVCVLPVSHPLAAKPFVAARDLDGVRFVGTGPNSMVQREVSRVFADLGVRCNVQVETPISAIACRLVAEGAGVTIADPFTASAIDRSILTVRRFVPEIPFNFGLIYPTHTPVSALVQDFVRAAQKARDQISASLLPAA